MTNANAVAEWRVHSARLAPLVDGEEYYPVLREALIEARQEVLILGWDLHTEIELLRGKAAEAAEREGGWPYRLADLLLALVEAREELHIRLLIWEGSSLFVFERQHIPRMLWPWARHPRITLEWDRDTPRLSSHHQKLVIIDGAFAFAGGMDLTAGRWDSHAHHREDERRVTPGLFSKESPPYHDVMLALDGEAAAVLGNWARERWRRATGETLEAPGRDGSEPDPWPAGLAPVFHEQAVEIALTQPIHRDYPEKRQVENSYIEQISEAKSLIYIESQYLTCGPIVDALCARLREEDGPEVVIVLPYGCPGTLQALCMDPLRDACLDQMREADRGGRFGAYWVTLRDGTVEDICQDAVYIHAKTMVVDRSLLRIGSANLNNRSMGLDTELDVTIRIAEGDEAGAVSVQHYRQRLMAYLLGVTPEDVAASEKETGTMLGAIEALRGGAYTLHPFEHRASALETTLALAPELADPSRPLTDIDADHVLKVIEDYSRRGERLRRRLAVSVGMLKRRRGLLAGAAIVMLVVALWTMTLLGDGTDWKALQGHLAYLRESPLGLVGVGLAFAALATVGFPLTVLITASGALLSASLAIPLCIVGVSLSAYVNFAIGRRAPRSLREYVAQKTPRSLERRLANLSVLGMVILRNMPVAPFAVVNVACGIIGVPRTSFLVGNALGALPGILVLTLLGHEARDLVSNPSPGGIAKVATLAVATIVVALAADRFLRKLDGRGAAASGARDG